MHPDEGVQRIEFHLSPESGSFIDMLRPYRGIRQEILDDLEHAVRAVAPLLAGPTVSRDLVGALWAICHFGRAWALDPDGMLRRNNLISKKDQAHLSSFLERISYAIMMLLDGFDVNTAFEA